MTLGKTSKRNFSKRESITSRAGQELGCYDHPARASHPGPRSVSFMTNAISASTRGWMSPATSILAPSDSRGKPTSDATPIWRIFAFEGEPGLEAGELAAAREHPAAEARPERHSRPDRHRGKFVGELGNGRVLSCAASTRLAKLELRPEKISGHPALFMMRQATQSRRSAKRWPRR